MSNRRPYKKISEAEKRYEEIVERQRILSDAFKNLESVAEDLDDLARVHFRLGQDNLGTELENNANFITKNIKIIRDEIAKKSDEDFKQSVQASATLFKGVIAGISIGKKGKKPEDITRDFEV